MGREPTATEYLSCGPDDNNCQLSRQQSEPKALSCKRAFGVTQQGRTNGYVSGEHFMIAARVFWTHQVESALRHVGGSTSAETDSDRSYVECGTHPSGPSMEATEPNHQCGDKLCSPSLLSQRSGMHALCRSGQLRRESSGRVLLRASYPA